MPLSIWEALAVTQRLNLIIACAIFPINMILRWLGIWKAKIMGVLMLWYGYRRMRSSGIVCVRNMIRWHIAGCTRRDRETCLLKEIKLSFTVMTSTCGRRIEG